MSFLSYKTQLERVKHKQLISHIPYLIPKPILADRNPIRDNHYFFVQKHISIKLRSMREKKGMVIGVGFQKTGTSTLRDALTILGYKVKDTTFRPLIPIIKKDWEKVLKILEGYDAVEDTPWYMIYKDLDRLIPNSKFILTIREPESWYKSVSRHIGDLKNPKHEYVYGTGKSLPKDNKENTLEVYNRHNQEVIEYFKDRPNDLLVIDFTKDEKLEKWQKICTFLGHDIPSEEFPHTNKWKVKEGEVPSFKKRVKFARKRFKNNLRIWYMKKKGYL